MIYLSQYRTHKSVEDLNASVKEHIYHNFDKLTKSDKQVLTSLAQHSLQYVGACHLKTETIAKEIGKSEKTVQRAINKLVSLKIITKHNTRKKHGQTGANIYSIHFFNPDNVHANVQQKMSDGETHEIPRSSKVEQVKHETVSLKSFNLSFNPSVNKNVNYVTAHGEDLKLQLRSIYQPSSVEGTQAFEELCKIAFGRLKQFMKSHKVPYLQMEQIVLKAMHDLVRKQGVLNQFALYSKMIERQTLQLFEQHIKPKQQTMHTFGRKVGVVPDWFEKGEHLEKKEQTLSDSEKLYFETQRKKLLAELRA